MADIYTPFLDALRAAIGSGCPEVTPNGIYLDVQLQQIPFEAKAEAGELPLAWIKYQFREDPRWGLANRSESGPVEVYLIYDDATLVEGGLLGTKLEAVRAAIRSSDLGSAAQVLNNPVCSVSGDLEPNRYLANAQRPFWVGRVMFDVLIGEAE